MDIHIDLGSQSAFRRSGHLQAWLISPVVRLLSYTAGRTPIATDLPTRHHVLYGAAVDVELISELPAPSRVPMVEAEIGDGGGAQGAVARLEEIMADVEEYDAGYLPPTTAAYRLARSLLTAAGNLYGVPSMGPLGDGGLTIEWGSVDHYVRLLIPPDPARAYFYSRSPTERVVEDATPEVLLQRLRWLHQT